MREISIIVT